MPKQHPIITYALLNTSLTALYVIDIGFFFKNAQAIFGPVDTALIPMMVLMLFVFSAAVCGALFLGRPILWYVEGKKKEAITLFLYSLAVLFVIILIIVGAMIAIK